MYTQNLIQKSSLDTRELLLLESEVKNQGKSMLVAYILWYFLGLFGGHRFYTGRTGTAIVQLVLSITVIGLIATGIWWIVDAFLLHTIVNDYNKNVESRIVSQIVQNKRNQQPPVPGSF